ncbi:PREDICTED: uncharacterized protein LOC108362463 [Rhagoletis zephyria]|uniref:uncharacterized protein LOC108362463 n=1 Tax=Rhagoletis zephyria TaxID=28612 RepID=UPI0008114CC7|nr:PREDICTED: uncharacterized protein LOC108362463 [Rhagoletis zephyria]
MQLFRKLIMFLLFVFVVGSRALPVDVSTLTFANVCEERGDWCSVKCQIAGGRDGYCNKAKICNCRQL